MKTLGVLVGGLRSDARRAVICRCVKVLLRVADPLGSGMMPFPFIRRNTLKGRSHASSINGQFKNSSHSRNGSRCGGLDGYRIFLGRLGDQRHREQTSRRAGEQRSCDRTYAALRREIPPGRRREGKFAIATKDFH